MPKKASKIDRVGVAQMSIFEAIREARALSTGKQEGTLNIRESLRSSLNTALKGCELSRFQVAGEMSHLLGLEVTKFMLDSWTAESKDGHRMPAEYLPAFCRATGAREPLEIMAQAAGMFALPGPDALRSEAQKLEEEAADLRERKRRVKALLKEMEGVA